MKSKPVHGSRNIDGSPNGNEKSMSREAFDTMAIVVISVVIIAFVLYFTTRGC